MNLSIISQHIFSNLFYLLLNHLNYKSIIDAKRKKLFDINLASLSYKLQVVHS